VADVVESTEIPGVWLIRPEIHTDERGRFLAAVLLFLLDREQLDREQHPERRPGGEDQSRSGNRQSKSSQNVFRS
jgi:dTDP-4-dehydrorhamnose 3,5-epimerase-like enzyme